jgi:hypothetical protein
MFSRKLISKTNIRKKTKEDEDAILAEKQILHTVENLIQEMGPDDFPIP